MSRRLVISAVLAGSAVASAGAALAQSLPLPPAPVTAGVSTQDGVGVTSSAGSQPLVGAHISPDGTVCAGFSYEMPQCVGGIVSP